MAETKIHDGTDWKAASGAKVWDGTQWVALTSGNTAPVVWQRPPDWIPTSVVAGEQKIQLLVAVYPNFSGNWATVVAGGAYTVDWGDGSAVENIASETLAQHQYTYGTLPANDTTSGWRQALVTITPQAGNLTRLTLTTAPTGVAGANFGNPVKEIVVGPPTLTVFTPNTYGLRRVAFLGGITHLSIGMFSGCRSLSEVSGSITLTNSATQAMFSYCHSLTNLTGLTLDTSGVTSSFYQMFHQCYSLQTVPTFTTSGGNKFTQMFNGCSSLRSIPDLDVSNGTEFDNMFAGCSSLTSVPALSTAGGTTFASMFQGCMSLSSVPPMNTSKGTSFKNMFNGCAALQSVPGLDTSLGTTFESMFTGCQSLSSVPALNTSAATTSTAFKYMFDECRSLVAIKGLSDISKGSTGSASYTDIFYYNYSLRTLNVTVGPKFSFSVTYTMLDAANLNALFTSLPTVTGQTITITNCPGAATCDRSIATAKGWTVTG